jgi:hypothetical protein
MPTGCIGETQTAAKIWLAGLGHVQHGQAWYEGMGAVSLLCSMCAAPSGEQGA